MAGDLRLERLRLGRQIRDAAGSILGELRVGGRRTLQERHGLRDDARASCCSAVVGMVEGEIANDAQREGCIRAVEERSGRLGRTSLTERLPVGLLAREVAYRVERGSHMGLLQALQPCDDGVRLGAVERQGGVGRELRNQHCCVHAWRCVD